MSNPTFPQWITDPISMLKLILRELNIIGRVTLELACGIPNIHIVIKLVEGFDPN